MNEQQEQALILRFSLATFLEGVRLYEEGIASAEEIDIAMQAGAGLPAGPFHWADARGLDAVLRDLQHLAATVGPRFAPPESLIERVSQGHMGVQSGEGYLAYETR